MQSQIMTYTKFVRSTLLRVANKETAAEQTKYFKHVIDFHGLKAPMVEKCWKESLKDPLQTKFPNVSDQLKVAYELMKSKYFEEKNVGIKILAGNVSKIIPKRKKKKTGQDSIEDALNGLKVITDLDEQLFQDEHIYDWGTCDTLSSQVICELIKRDSSLGSIVQQWKDSSNIWQQRSACVSFVKIAKHGEFNDIIFDICSTTVQNKERFVQLGTGWVLRELSLADLDAVTMFIKRNYSNFSREGLRYAIEKMDSKLKSKLLAYSKGDSQSEVEEESSEESHGASSGEEMEDQYEE
ncbi:hypothetical protein C9374_014200 [Naegleria lovaniensis]|uniref:DNA alkylation repair enzyme n=1 Tax=Naegleria lovaniensis TaxID=51637 RepID=A0AA88GYY5_NAELO|nr:uncharacterized protein C9374_014200 [Naegleria lovaniensis]KAG2389640.1 hypothetical protein C9374_014200 [Naegleria lovaniensis]